MKLYFPMTPLKHSALWELIAILGTVAGVAAACAPFRAEKRNAAERNPAGLSRRAAVQAIWKYRLTRHQYAPMHPEEFAAAEIDPSGKRLWIGSSAHIVWAFDTHTGRPLWKRKMDGAVVARPLYVAARKLLFVGCGDGCLHALHADTGKTVWKYCTKGIIYEPPVYRLGVVYFTNSKNYVYAVDAKTGKWRWSYDRDPPEGFNIRGHGAPVLDGNRLFAGFSDGYLVSLDTRTGNVNWTRSLTGEAREYVDVDATPVIDDGVLYVTSYAGGVYALTPELGAMKWRYEAKAATGVAVADDRIYFASARKGLHCLDKDGHLVWRQKIDGGSPTRPLTYHDLLIVGTSKLGLIFVKRANGEFLQRFDPGFGVSAEPSIFKDRLFVLENGGRLFGFRLF